MLDPFFFFRRTERPTDWAQIKSSLMEMGITVDDGGH